MLVLAFTAQLTVPVGDAQVVVHQRVAHVAVPQHRVEERLQGETEAERHVFWCTGSQTMGREPQFFVSHIFFLNHYI